MNTRSGAKGPKGRIHHRAGISHSPLNMQWYCRDTPASMRRLAAHQELAEFAERVAWAEKEGLISHRQAAELDESIRLRINVRLARYKLKVWVKEGEDRMKRKRRVNRERALRRAAARVD